MQVAGKHLRMMIEEICIVRISLDELIPRQSFVQIPKMMGQQRLTVLDEADCGLQMSTKGNHLGCVLKSRR